MLAPAAGTARVSATRDELVQLYKDGQRAFAADVDLILTEMKDYTASILPAVGEVSHGEALEALRAVTMKAFGRALERR